MKARIAIVKYRMGTAFLGRLYLDRAIATTKLKTTIDSGIW